MGVDNQIVLADLKDHEENYGVHHNDKSFEITKKFVRSCGLLRYAQLKFHRSAVWF